MAAGVRYDFSGLRGMAREVRHALNTTGAAGPVRTMLRQWGARYLGFVDRRFVHYSRGGGNWKPLAPSTLKRRRRGKGSGSPAILVDTATLVGATRRGSIGNVFEDVPGAIRVGFGPSSHPRGKMTIADIAAVHNLGSTDGRIPQRAILVPPDEATVSGMMGDAKRAIRTVMRTHDMGRSGS